MHWKAEPLPSMRPLVSSMCTTPSHEREIALALGHRWPLEPDAGNGIWKKSYLRFCIFTETLKKKSQSFTANITFRQMALKCMLAPLAPTILSFYHVDSVKMGCVVYEWVTHNHPSFMVIKAWLGLLYRHTLLQHFPIITRGKQKVKLRIYRIDDFWLEPFSALTVPGATGASIFQILPVWGKHQKFIEQPKGRVNEKLKKIIRP